MTGKLNLITGDRRDSYPDTPAGWIEEFLQGKTIQLRFIENRELIEERQKEIDTSREKIAKHAHELRSLLVDEPVLEREVGELLLAAIRKNCSEHEGGVKVDQQLALDDFLVALEEKPNAPSCVKEGAPDKEINRIARFLYTGVFKPRDISPNAAARHIAEYLTRPATPRPVKQKLTKRIGQHFRDQGIK